MSSSSKGFFARRRARPGAALVMALFTLGTPQAHAVDDTRARIGADLAGTPKLLGKSALGHGAFPALQQLYTDSGNAPLWSHDGQPTARAHALLAELTAAESYGLRLQDYGAVDLEALLHGLGAGPAAQHERLAQFDVRLSAATLRFLSDLHFGRVSAQAAGFQLQEAREPFDLAAALKAVADAPQVVAALTAAEPVFVHYKLLKDALAHYRELQQAPALAPLPPLHKTVKVGDAYAGAPALRQLLQRRGDLSPGGGSAASELLFDDTLSAAVAHFQGRHGLTVDGNLGKATLAALQTPIAKRVRQITLALERWRWLAPFKTPPIIVNIPQFRLFAFRTTDDRVADILQMDVIVGRTYAYTQTPVFRGDMKYVVLRPYWDVPRSIVRNEMLPKFHADPRYFASQHLELVDGPSDSSAVVAPTAANIEALAAGRLRLRQQPGEDNALGLAKFMFPNSYNVYLHSTPAHQLFKQSVRAFSHGCIRVADPVALATLVLKNADGNWTTDKIQAAMNGDASLRVPLTRSIDVLILYATALATEAGPVLFFDDIYGYDRKLEKQLGLAPVR